VVHAIKLVGSLKSSEAALALVDAIFLAYSTRNEIAMDDLPVVLAKIGPAAVKPLASVLEDRRLEVTVRSIAGSALEGIAVLHPDLRSDVLESFRKAVSDSDELSALRSHAITILAHFRNPEDCLLVKRAMTNMPMLDIAPHEVDEYFAQNEDPPEWDEFEVDLLEYYDDELA
jgi:hypothetical protein